MLSRSRSTGVEKMIGVGVLRSDAKSRSRLEGRGSGVGDLSAVGEAGSERVDETERRLVRAGVRTGWIGGAFDDPEELCRGGVGLCALSSSSWTVSGWLLVMIRWGSSDLRRVVSLAVRWRGVNSNGSSGVSSGVVGVVEVPGVNKESAVDKVDVSDVPGSGSYLGLCAVNHGWARIWGIVRRFNASFWRMFLIRSRDSELRG